MLTRVKRKPAWLQL